MNGKKAKAARRAAHPGPPARSRLARHPFWFSWKGGLIGLVAAAVITGSFVVPGLLQESTAAGAHAGMAMGVAPGAGLRAGSPVPAFSERDVQSGNAITSTTVSRQKALLFFSEGVMCQACFEQIKGLEKFGAQLDERGIELISITPDSPSDLRRAVSLYGITTPMIADENRDMSEAFNTLGQGMHGDAPGHAFVLVSGGTVLWYRDYWLAPTRSMYVEPGRLLADIPT